ncbi:MAG TPA: DUF423 domain-containing protein [Bacteroidia bacterium]|jgi:uncharacterized membrane protein YgdD (TMEM256/DUF423 family)|nr:DUF423 domain-containing protein [Bacteroidia bacterium]
MRKGAMVFAGISGCLAVIFGAFGAHYLREKVKLSPEDMHPYETAVSYQFFHTLAILGAFSVKDRFPLYNKAIGMLFMLGIILFSGSLYVITIGKVMGTDLKLVGAITPLGGLCFIAGWACLAFSAYKQTEANKQ